MERLGDRETSGRHEPASQYLASDRRDGDTTPEPASQHVASDRRDLGRQGDKRETPPRSRRHSIWHLTAETGRHRETSRRHSIWHLTETGRHRDKRETQPWSRRDSIWHLTGETGRQEDKQKQDPGIGVTLSHSLYLKLEPQCFAVWGKRTHSIRHSTQEWDAVTYLSRSRGPRQICLSGCMFGRPMFLFSSLSPVLG